MKGGGRTVVSPHLPQPHHGWADARGNSTSRWPEMTLLYCKIHHHYVANYRAGAKVTIKFSVIYYKFKKLRICERSTIINFFFFWWGVGFFVFWEAPKGGGGTGRLCPPLNPRLNVDTSGRCLVPRNENRTRSSWKVFKE